MWSTGAEETKGWKSAGPGCGVPMGALQRVLGIPEEKSQTLCCLPPHSHRLLGGGEAGRGEWKARTEGYLGNGFLVIPAQGLLIHSFIQKNESIRLYYLVKSYLIHFTFECLVTYSVYSSKQHIYRYISTGIAHIHTQRQTCCIWYWLVSYLSKL